MLACVRQTTRRLPRLASFSTSAVQAQEPPQKKKAETNQTLTSILDTEANRKHKPHYEPPKLTPVSYSAYRIFAANQPLFPNDLVYKNVVLKQKLHKKPVVAPGPAITRHKDTFHQFDLDPRHFTNNGAVLSHFVTEMGKIKSRDQTGLTLKTQRLMGRTIRRAKMMGVIPTLSKGYKRYF